MSAKDCITCHVIPLSFLLSPFGHSWAFLSVPLLYIYVFKLIFPVEKRRWDPSSAVFAYEGEDKELECGGNVAVGSQGRHVRDLQDAL